MKWKKLFLTALSGLGLTLGSDVNAQQLPALDLPLAPKPSADTHTSSLPQETEYKGFTKIEDLYVNKSILKVFEEVIQDDKSYEKIVKLHAEAQIAKDKSSSDEFLKTFVSLIKDSFLKFTQEEKDPVTKSRLKSTGESFLVSTPESEAFLKELFTGLKEVNKIGQNTFMDCLHQALAVHSEECSKTLTERQKRLNALVEKGTPLTLANFARDYCSNEITWIEPAIDFSFAPLSDRDNVAVQKSVKEGTDGILDVIIPLFLKREIALHFCSNPSQRPSLALKETQSVYQVFVHTLDDHTFTTSFEELVETKKQDLIKERKLTRNEGISLRIPVGGRMKNAFVHSAEEVEKGNYPVPFEFAPENLFTPLFLYSDDLPSSSKAYPQNLRSKERY